MARALEHRTGAGQSPRGRNRRNGTRARTGLTWAAFLLLGAVVHAQGSPYGGTPAPRTDTPAAVPITETDPVAPEDEKDPKKLLAASRAALKAGDLDNAEQLARLSARYAGRLTFPIWGDSPAKALKDVQAARARIAAAERKDETPAPKKSAGLLGSLFGKKKEDKKPDTPETPAAPAADQPETAQAPAEKPKSRGVLGNLFGKKKDAKKPEDKKPDTETAQVPAPAEKPRSQGVVGNLFGKKKDAKKPDTAVAAKPDETPKADDAPSSGGWRDMARPNTDPQPGKETAKTVGWRDLARPGTKSEQPAPVADKTPTPPAPSDNIPRGNNEAGDREAARRLVARGREALKDGDCDKATSLARQARALRPNLNFWEDTPDRLLRDVQKAVAAADAKQPDVKTASVKETKPDVAPETTAKRPAPRGKDSALAMLKECRQAIAKGEFDNASDVLQSAREYKGRYGLFDDTPDKVHADLVKARQKHDRVEAAKVMKDARKLFEKGEFEESQKLAYKAQQLHGPYSIWEAGDRPNKLLADIDNARRKKESGTAVVKKDDKKPDTRPAPDGNRQKALALMADARKLEADGKLLEARQKLTDARDLKAGFAAEEVSPERMLQRLTALARQRSEVMADQAVHLAAYGKGDPKGNVEQAESTLVQARLLAEGFKLDVAAIDQKKQSLAQMKARVGLPVPPVGTDVAAGPTPRPEPENPKTAQGLRLLEDSRLDMRALRLSVARQKAEQVYLGDYGLKEQAKMRLREIDIEENNQKVLKERREFDAGVAAFNRREYFQAREILTGLNPSRLDDTRQARLREVMAAPEMGTKTDIAAVDLKGSPPGKATATDKGDPPGTATASDTDFGKPTVTEEYGDDILKAHKAMKSIKMQEMRQESLAVQREAAQLSAQGDHDGAVAALEGFLARLDVSQLDADSRKMVDAPVRSRMQKYSLLRQQAEIDRAGPGARKKPLDIMLEKNLSAQTKQKNVANMMKQFNTLFREGKYAQAEQYARMAHELDPDNEVTTAAMTVARTRSRLEIDKKRKQGNEEFNYGMLQDVGKLGPYPGDENPLHVDKKRAEFIRNSKFKNSLEASPTKSKAAREIEGKLDLPVNMNFTDAPLKTVMDDLRSLHGINVQPDYLALKTANISLDRPISAQLEGVSLKSALNIITKQAELTWVIRDEVLTITTKDGAKEKMVQKTYLVADLVIPINNSELHPMQDFNNALERAYPSVNDWNRVMGGRTPQGMSQQDLSGGSQVGSNYGDNPRGGSGAPAGAGPNGTAPGGMNGGNWNGTGRAGPANAMPQHIIRLITNTIAPDSWTDKGGQATIDYFDLGLSLVINQTPDIQEQIQDLLQQLRRLQDVEVSLEVRLITLSDNFFERMGVDMDINIKTDRDTARYEPQLLSGNFKPAGFVNDFNPSKFVAGILPGGAFTRDLDIPLFNNSFSLAYPPFGFQRELAAGNTGGLSLGLAFLSDIQVYLFMEAAQSDQRFNIMQAPRLTMFNGQSATLSVQSIGSFVTGVVPVNPAGYTYFLPLIQPLPQGTSVGFQPVVTGDRRFVRINMQLQLTNLKPVVQIFPITVTSQVLSGGGLQAVPPPLVLTQFIQQPQFDQFQVQTTVQVPDGGTVVIGGLKRLAEGRNEFGPPILSKIPYINRLVKNVGYGRETEHILMLITPRVIITEEEETIQTGVIPFPSLAQ